jgi:hypothetical protein
MRSTHGQATIDYVAVIALLALVFGAALALSGDGSAGIVNAAVGQFRYALCVVGGGPCRDPRPRPCTVAGTRDAHHLAVNLALVRADDDRYVLRERMSDGSVRLTVGRSSATGVEGGIGGTATFALKGRRVGVSDEARGRLQGVLGSGQVYVAHDDHEADAFMRAIDDGHAPLAPAREVFVEGGLRGTGRVGIGGSTAGASLDGLAGALIGTRRDRQTGDTTFSLNSTASQGGALTIALGGPMGLMNRVTTLALTVDKDHRARELSLSSSGTLAASAKLPLAMADIPGMGPRSSARGSGRRWEQTAHLDLLDPVVAPIWARFRHDPLSGAAIRALGQVIGERAQLDARSYSTASSSNGASAGLSLGVRLGGELEHTIDRSTLLAASWRPPGGLWESRVDCVA